jgi:hypothetical protein
MTRFSVTAWCERPFYAQLEVEAETPQEALADARELIADEPAEVCDHDYSWDEWRVDSPDTEGDAEGVLLILDEPARLRTAAPKLLEALLAAAEWIDAQHFVQRTLIQETIRQAIAEATGRAA